MSFVTCPNCGAEFDSELNHRICPYCGAEETEKVISDTKEQIQDINESTERYKGLPERVAHFMTRRVTILVLILAAVAIFLVVNTKNEVKEEQIQEAINLDEFEREL